MFDVIWTDPDRELVGEHRAKKEKKREKQQQQQQSKKDKDRKRSSISAKRGSLSAAADSPFFFLRSHALKRNNNNDANANISSSKLVGPISTPRPAPPLTTPHDVSSRPSSGIAPTCSSDEPSSTFPARPTSEDDRSPGLSRHDSIFSKYAGSDIGTAPSVADMSLSDQGRTSLKATGTIAKGKPGNALSNMPEHADMRHPSYVQVTRPPSSKQPPALLSHLNTEQPVLVPGPLTPAKSSRRQRVHDPGAWRTPEQWAGGIEKDETIEMLNDMISKCDTSSMTSEDLPFDLEICKQETQQMLTMSLEDIATRLRMVCSRDTRGEKKEGKVDAEAIRWILWALSDLEAASPQNGASLAKRNILRKEAERMLIFHESQEITSHLATLFPSSDIHHLSTSPLLDTFSPKLTPITVTSTDPAALPATSELYDTIISLSLTSILPTLDIQPTLQHLSSLLSPSSGSIAILIIDPLPRAGTLGRHLHAWLRANLLINLDISCRTATPSRIIPQLLSASSLRGNGSTITTTRFFANPGCIPAHAEDIRAAEASGMVNPSGDERVHKAEIRSLVGRLLWKHIWGPFVKAGRRGWWDDALCMNECLELGTIWEYHLIEGVKAPKV